MREAPSDADEVEYLLDLTFAPGRAALSSYQLRGGVDPVAALCTIARDEYDALVGAIRYWPVEITRREEPALPALLLGPIAVHNTRQGEGLGALLIIETLDLARELGWERVVLIGDEPYYRRFGFRRALTHGLDFPRPVNFDRLLGTELVPNALHGITGTVSKLSNSCRMDE